MRGKRSAANGATRNPLILGLGWTGRAHAERLRQDKSLLDQSVAFDIVGLETYCGYDRTDFDRELISRLVHLASTVLVTIDGTAEDGIRMAKYAAAQARNSDVPLEVIFNIAASWEGSKAAHRSSLLITFLLSMCATVIKIDGEQLFVDEEIQDYTAYASRLEDARFKAIRTWSIVTASKFG